MKPKLATLLVLLTASTVWSAPPAAPAPATINLTKSVGSNPVGVEPQDGRFAQVIDPKAEPRKGEYTFSTYTKNQPKSVLAIYATNQSLIPFENPIARVELSGLRRGVTQQRIRVQMSLTSNRTLSVSAVDLKYGAKLTVTQIPISESQLAKLKAPSRPQDRKLPAIALGNESPGTGLKQSGAGLKQFIGIRHAGGMFEPLLHPDDKPQRSTTTFTTRYPGQLTADIKLFAGDSPYIENTKPFARYIVSGLTPNGRRQNSIKFALEVGPDGSIIPSATETKSGANLSVVKYSDDAVRRLVKQEQQQARPADNIPDRIPPAPTL